MNSTAPKDTTVSDATREMLADYYVLQAYDLARTVRYGDMARARRERELARRAVDLVRAGVSLDATGHFPAVTREALTAAWDRTIEPRRRRFEASVTPWRALDGTLYARETRYARATRAAFAAAAHAIGVSRETWTEA